MEIYKESSFNTIYKVAVIMQNHFIIFLEGLKIMDQPGDPQDEREGIANKHWYKTLGADGHQSATDPVYNDIIHGEYQQGVLFRVDLTSGETVSIQPKARLGEPHERFNWDAPILVSPHNPNAYILPHIEFGNLKVEVMTGSQFRVT